MLVTNLIKRAPQQTFNFYLFSKYRATGIHSTRTMACSKDTLPDGMRNDWNFKSWTEKDIMDRLPDVLKQIQSLYDKAGTADINNLCFETFLQPLLQVQRLTFGNYWWHGTLGSPIVFPKLVAVSKEVRDAAGKAGKEIDDLTLEMFMRYKQPQQYQQ